MEFKLPFPTLLDLSALAIAHSLMDLDANDRSLIATGVNSLRDSLEKVDKLDILEQQKCHIREVLRGTHDHLQNWFACRSFTLHPPYTRRPNLQFDVYGCVDAVRMARDLLKNCHLDERYNDLKALSRLLRIASYYVLLPNIQEILQKILKLLAADSIIPLLDGPEFQIDTDEKLCLVYRFVNQQGIPMSLNVDYFDNIRAISAFRVSNSCLHVTLHQFQYNSELFYLHRNLLDESKRIPFVKNLIIKMTSNDLVHQVVNILHFLDPDSQRCILNEIHREMDNYQFLHCLLVWPYQVFFLPAFQLISSLRELTFVPVSLFDSIVYKQEMMALQEILHSFWEANSSVIKSSHSHFSPIKNFDHVLKELSQKNVPMYKRIATDMNFPLTYLPKSRKRKHDESSSSKSDV